MSLERETKGLNDAYNAFGQGSSTGCAATIHDTHRTNDEETGPKVVFDLRLSVGLMLWVRACLYWNSLPVSAAACIIGVRTSIACANGQMIYACSLFSVMFAKRYQHVTRGFRELLHLTWRTLGGMPRKRDRGASPGRSHSRKTDDTEYAMPDLLWPSPTPPLRCWERSPTRSGQSKPRWPDRSWVTSKIGVPRRQSREHSLIQTSHREGLQHRRNRRQTRRFFALR